MPDCFCEGMGLGLRDRVLLKIGVSACLLGEQVRYDGGHKRNQALLDCLSEGYELVPICPEVAVGMGVPRPPVHLITQGAEIRAVGVADERLDVTLPLTAYGQQVAVAGLGLSGFVFKSRSPSCGFGTTPIQNGDGSHHYGNGLFAAQIVQILPELPVIDEVVLQQPVLRALFLRRVDGYGQRSL